MSISSRSRQLGFTLMELLTTLCIAGVLAVIGMPALGSMLARSHTQSAENALQASLMHARETAVTRGVQVIVCPSTDARHCDAGDDWQHGWLVAADTDHDRRPDNGASPLAVFDALPSGMRVIASRGRPLIVFRPDGSAAGSNAELTLCHRGDQRGGQAVVIANSGRVRIAAALPDRLRQCLTGMQ
ncbi:MAG: GspH/FimT family pseudopilin [Rhodanobacteraceae bacterium]